MQCVLSRNKFFLFVDNLVVYVEYTKELKGKKKRMPGNNKQV